MTTLTWSHASSVGIRAMDDQHGILLDAMNDLRLAGNRGAGREELARLLHEFIEFARMHFSSEEMLLTEYGYPEIEAHRAEHQRMLSHLHEFTHSMLHGDGASVGVLLRLLSNWFNEHTATLDHKYGDWLNERGVF